MKKSRRFLALLLSIFMVMTLLPAISFAEQTVITSFDPLEPGVAEQSYQQGTVDFGDLSLPTTLAAQTSAGRMDIPVEQWVANRPDLNKAGIYQFVPKISGFSTARGVERPVIKVTILGDEEQKQQGEQGGRADIRPMMILGVGSQASPLIIDSGQTLLEFSRAYNSDTLDEVYGTNKKMLSSDGSYYDKLYVELAADIDLNGLTWEPIGVHFTENAQPTRYRDFMGHFDGKEFVIRNLRGAGGLFGKVNGGSIQNLKLENIEIRGSQGSIGGLINDMQAGVVENAHILSGSVRNSEQDGDAGTGGLIGQAAAQDSTKLAKITVGRTSSRAAVSGVNNVGGLAGRMVARFTNNNITLKESYAKGDVSASENGAGGLLGRFTPGDGSTANLDHAYATGRVQAKTDAGGLIGFLSSYNGEGSRYAVNNVYATGNVSASVRNAGGLIGRGEIVTKNFGDFNNAAALNDRVNGADNVGRVMGFDQSRNFKYNGAVYAWTGMIRPDKGEANIRGKDAIDADLKVQQERGEVWQSSKGWSVPPWKKEADMLPYLEGDTPMYPSYITSRFHGSGTAEDPYQIHNKEDLLYLARETNAGNNYGTMHYILMDNLNLSAYDNWTTIGDDINGFKGHFDGNGKFISGVTVKNQNNRADIGLFGSVTDAGSVKNLGAQVNIEGSDRVGGLVGRTLGNSSAEPVKITNCYTLGSIKGKNNVGGIVGDASRTTIEDCYTTATIEGTDNVAGIAGGTTTAPVKIDNGVVMSQKISGNNNVGRITGFSATLSGNAAWEHVLTKANDENWPNNNENGTSLSAQDLNLLQNGGGTWSTYTLDDGWRRNAEIPYFGNDSGLLPDHIKNYFKLEGAGTQADPYKIGNARELRFVAERINERANGFDGIQHYQLTADIDLAGEKWTPIGTNDTNRFKGVFDGKNKVIKNMTIEETGNNRGLFGYTGSAEIKNLGLINYNIYAGTDAGGLVGRAQNTTIQHCYAIGNLRTTNNANNTGGLVGQAEKSTIVFCFSKGNISGSSNVGGLVGSGVASSKIQNCYSTANVTGSNNVGGLVGTLLTISSGNAKTIAEKVYASGNVKGSSNVGGVAGAVGYQAEMKFATAMNREVETHKAEDTNLGRVVGSIAGGGSVVTDIFAFDGMSYPPGKGSATVDGTDASQAKLDWQVTNDNTSPWYSYPEAVGEWLKAGQQIPTLKEEGVDSPMGYQNSNLPVHVKGGLEGDGSNGTPYLIYSAEDLAFMRDKINSNAAGYAEAGKEYKLMNDLDLSLYGSGEGWVPIGSQANPSQIILHGGEHVIRNLTISRNNIDYQGLFGSVGGGSIGSLGLEQVNVSGRSKVGGLAGNVAGGATIESAYVQGAVNGWSEVGGVLGTGDGNARHLYFIGTVTGQSSTIGGAIGSSNGGTLENIHAQGAVNGNANTGGVVGLLNNATARRLVALQHEVTGSGIGRVVGSLTGSNTLDSLFANEGMSGAAWSGRAQDQKDGADAAAEQLDHHYGNSSAWQDGSWGSNPWTKGDQPVPYFAWGGYRGSYPLNITKRLRGRGIDDDPYQIYNADDLSYVRDKVNQGVPHFQQAWYVVMRDIDLSGIVSWTPIGQDSAPFESARFDGQGFGIGGLNVNASSDNNQGLFGAVNNGTITNVRLTGARVIGQQNVGLLAGKVTGTSTLSNIFAQGEADGQVLGGLVGLLQNGSVRNIQTTGSLNGGDNVGGIVGRADSGNVSDSHSDMTVTGGDKVGGIVGQLDGGNVSFVYAAGTISGSGNVGGVVGGTGGTTTISNAVALNHTISGGTAGRILADRQGTSTLNGNAGWMDVNVTPLDAQAQDDRDGENRNAKELDMLRGDYADNVWDKGSGANWTRPPWQKDKSIPYIFQGGEMPTYINELEGDGSAATPYLIKSPADLAFMRDKVNDGNANYVAAHYRVENALDLSVYAADAGWLPIGTAAHPFAGDFNGNGQIISNLTVNTPSAPAGLFGAAQDCSMYDLTLDNVNVSGGGQTGGLAGLIKADDAAKEAKVSGVLVTGRVKSGGNDVGGAVGALESLQNKLTMAEVIFKGDVLAADTSENVGGIAGRILDNNELFFTNNYTFGSVVGGKNVGGVIGASESDQTTALANIYSRANVAGEEAVGGVIGLIKATGQKTTLTNTYATGKVSGSQQNAAIGRVGGIAGRAEGSGSGEVEISAAVALNESIGTSGDKGRILGSQDGSVALDNNLAWDELGVWTPEGATTINGRPLSLQEIWDGEFWETTFDKLNYQILRTQDVHQDEPGNAASDDWWVEETFLPVIYGVSGQDNSLPLHLSRSPEQATITLSVPGNNTNLLLEDTVEITATIAGTHQRYITWQTTDGDLIPVVSQEQNKIILDTQNVTTPQVTVTAILDAASDIKAEITFNVKFYTVTFETGEEATDISPVITRPDKPIAAPADPLWLGYMVDTGDPVGSTSGWYIDNNYQQDWDFADDVTRNMTLYVKWMRNPGLWAQVNFDPQNGDPVKETYVLHYSKVPVPTEVPEKEGSEFAFWAETFNKMEYDFTQDIQDPALIELFALYASQLVAQPEDATVSFELSSDPGVAIDKAEMNKTITMIVQPDAGFYIADPDNDVKFTYDGVETKAVHLGNNVYSFTMPNGAPEFDIAVAMHNPFDIYKGQFEHGEVATTYKEREINQAPPGMRVVIEPKPESGYKVKEDSIKVLDSTDTEVMVENHQDGRYSFIMPDKTVTVSEATFEVNRIPTLDKMGTFTGSEVIFGRYDGDHEQVQKVIVNGTEIDRYQLSAGSAVITMNHDYLMEQSNGTYLVDVVFSNGIAYDQFVVQRDVSAGTPTDLAGGGIGGRGSGAGGDGSQGQGQGGGADGGFLESLLGGAGNTGDVIPWLLIGIAAVSALLLVVLLLYGRKGKKKKE